MSRFIATIVFMVMLAGIGVSHSQTPNNATANEAAFRRMEMRQTQINLIINLSPTPGSGFTRWADEPDAANRLRSALETPYGRIVLNEFVIAHRNAMEPSCRTIKNLSDDNLESIWRNIFTRMVMTAYWRVSQQFDQQAIMAGFLSISGPDAISEFTRLQSAPDVAQALRLGQSLWPEKIIMSFADNVSRYMLLNYRLRVATGHSTGRPELLNYAYEGKERELDNLIENADSPEFKRFLDLSENMLTAHGIALALNRSTLVDLFASMPEIDAELTALCLAPYVRPARPNQ